MANNEVKPSSEKVVEYVREKTAGINWTSIILPVGAVFLGYEFLKSQGLISPTVPTSTATTADCPRGQRYSRGYFGSCDPNYVDAGLKYGWFSPTCECLTWTGPVTSAPRKDGMRQSNYEQFPTDDRIQLSLDKWRPLTKGEKLVLGIVSK